VRAASLLRGLGVAAALTSAAFAACIPYTEAPKRIGESVCVTGKVVKVVEAKSGAWFLDFCDDYKKCPFTVVVFARSLRDVGDVRKLAGTDIEIFGKVKLYNGRAEIILNDARQLHGESAKLPPMPKEYDASRHGSYSAGRYRTKGKPADLDPEKR
jgi:DNA/RNA endonuclease YhcR with UshA esterase domain